tara:strand:+ start:3677 stop:4876 length:1200 start_codon:yes stop_codon:yes gene_type:complete
MIKKTLNTTSNLKLTKKFDDYIKILFGVGILFSIISFFSYFMDKHHFFYSYLTSFSFFLTLSLGGMFIVLIHHVTRTGWSVVIRRVPEGFMKNIGLMALFSIPILFGLEELYHWAHDGAALHDHLLAIKAPYLNPVFFVFRVIIYFLLWNWIASHFFNKSVSQDETGDEANTFDLQKRSTYSLIIFGFTISFAGIDYIMSLTPHWYSTIFGVYIFAGAVLVAYCFISLVFLFLRANNLLTDIVNIEHYHDLGKLIYGFNIFWSYIAFSQFFLIWYANIPEEVLFFADHFAGSWNTIAIILSVGHFGIPFLFFMSRHVKRNLALHMFFAIWLVVMHFIDLFWIIMPNFYKGGFSISFFDIAPFFAIGCIFFAFFFNRLKKHSLIPIKDPRLSEALNFENF